MALLALLALFLFQTLLFRPALTCCLLFAKTPWNEEVEHEAIAAVLLLKSAFCWKTPAPAPAVVLNAP
jgi:hypothetical protein